MEKYLIISFLNYGTVLALMVTAAMLIDGVSANWSGHDQDKQQIWILKLLLAGSAVMALEWLKEAVLVLKDI